MYRRFQKNSYHFGIFVQMISNFNKRKKSKLNIQMPPPKKSEWYFYTLEKKKKKKKKKNWEFE